MFVFSLLVKINYKDRCSRYIFSLYFFSGEIEKPCVLVLVDDTEHEEEEELRLVLGSPKSESPFGATIGVQNETLIKLKDDADSKNALFSCYMLFLTIFLFKCHHVQNLYMIITSFKLSRWHKCCL